MSYIRKPSPPQGSDPREQWMRSLLQWVSQFELTSIVGGLKKPNPGGGYSLVIPNNSIGGGDHPFRIYQTTSWLKYKVTTGWFKPNGATIVPTDVETEITITSGVAEYWFWLEVTNTTASVASSATEPDWTINQIPIGWVDTNTYSGDSRAVINQFLKDHVYIPCL